MDSRKLLARVYEFISLILVCSVVVSCDEPYVPKEQRLTFIECERILVDLQAFVRKIYLQKDNSIVSLTEIADNWADSETGTKHRFFEETLDICASKQFAAKKSEKYIGPDYETAYAALTAIDSSVQAYGTKRRAKTHPAELERRLSLIEAMAVKIVEAYDSK